jgi:hypothetical protein
MNNDLWLCIVISVVWLALQEYSCSYSKNTADAESERMLWDVTAALKCIVCLLVDVMQSVH